MSEIEKLYENVRVEKDCFVMHECLSAHSNCKNCNKTFYPDFTAEKQLELIKFLLNKYCDIRIRRNLEGAYYFSSFNDISCFSEDFEETLASFTNIHLQDLTEGEKQQVREILE